MENNIKIIVLSDTHGKHNKVNVGDDSDLIIHCGDFSAIGQRYEVEDFFKWFSELKSEYKILIPGNHDLCADPDKNKGSLPEWFKNTINKFQSNPNNYYLNNNGCIIKNLKIWGSGITPWFYGEHWALNKHRGPSIKQVWDQIPLNTNIIITHGPVYMKHDLIETVHGPNYGHYVGCQDLDFRVKEIKPLLHLCGHIHSGRNYQYENGTHYINASILNDNYVVVNKPIELNIVEDEVNVKL